MAMSGWVVMVVVNPHHALLAKRLKGLQRGKRTNIVPVEKLKGRVVSNLINSLEGMAWLYDHGWQCPVLLNPVTE